MYQELLLHCYLEITRLWVSEDATDATGDLLDDLWDAMDEDHRAKANEAVKKSQSI